ncbi:MAG: RNA 3'-terminal phosphate cyclase [Arenicella sp.]
MKIINGSQGEGGGQILRSALALSMCTGTPIRIENIRAGRKKPGLLRQHLTCVRASQSICNAEVSGDELRSEAIEFKPQTVQGGDYEFAIGSAGSTSLVFQTVLPALLMADKASTVTLSGGTHNGMAPSFDFIKHSFLPALANINIKVDAELKTYGFFPVGGGQWTATIQPFDGVKKLDLSERGELVSKLATVTQAKISNKVAARELEHIQKKLYWAEDELRINQVNSIGPGNIVSLHANSEAVTEVIEVVGDRGLSAERVAGRAVAEMKRYMASEAAVGEHLCDQLLLPLALGNGGNFTTLQPSLHTLTNIDVIKQFMDCEITVEEKNSDCFMVIIKT